jgi:prepilin signal peptidase PulO-like enzyme (type II secretory pathway)
MILLILFFFGLCLGSFVNALVWRLRLQEKAQLKKQKTRYSIVNGRSVCTHCKHILAPKDLIPLISWLTLNGRCRYCGKQIGWHYPTVELVTALVFIVSYLFWPTDLTVSYNIVGLTSWLIILVGLVGLFVYDLKYFILPNKIIFPLLSIALIGLAVQSVLAGDFSIIVDGLAGGLIGGGIFYSLFQISDGKWIGGGDVKLGFLLGLLVGGAIEALLFLFIASLLGSLVSIPAILSKKANIKTKIPFGPFLIAGAFVTVLFGEGLLDWYNQLLVGG